jgi:flagellar motility protein MotE (MotC chaperone)
VAAAEDGAERTKRTDEGLTGWPSRGVRWAIGLALGLKLAGLLATGHGAPVATALAEDAPAAGPALAVVKPRAVESTGEHAKGAGAHASATDVKALLESLSRRQAELDQREKTLAAREEKLALYEKDVTEKIAHLEQVGKTLKEELKRTHSATDEAAASLAKVYGAMKPSEAAPILDQLDEATALRILTRMKEKQVGEILPLMTRERAIGLTRSLAGRTPAGEAAKPRG